MNEPGQMLEYFEPTNRKSSNTLLVPPVGRLEGKRIAFVNNGWVCFTKMGEHVEALLVGQGVAEVPTYAIPPSAAPQPGVLERIAAECDAAIVGLAN
jgi:hypothetical protein